MTWDLDVCVCVCDEDDFQVRRLAGASTDDPSAYPTTILYLLSSLTTYTSIPPP